MAIALGANIVERHFVDNFNRKGPDVICSMDEQALRELLTASEEIPLMIGGKKGAIDQEQVTINFAFSTVVSIKDIKKGEVFTKNNIWVKRPGTGKIPAEKYDSIIGKIATRDINNDEHIDYDMIGEDIHE